MYLGRVAEKDGWEEKTRERKENNISVINEVESKAGRAGKEEQRRHGDKGRRPA